MTGIKHRAMMKYVQMCFFCTNNGFFSKCSHYVRKIAKDSFNSVLFFLCFSHLLQSIMAAPIDCHCPNFNLCSQCRALTNSRLPCTVDSVHIFDKLLVLFSQTLIFSNKPCFFRFAHVATC